MMDALETRAGSRARGLPRFPRSTPPLAVRDVGNAAIPSTHPAVIVGENHPFMVGGCLLRTGREGGGGPGPRCRDLMDRFHRGQPRCVRRTSASSSGFGVGRQRSRESGDWPICSAGSKPRLSAASPSVLHRVAHSEDLPSSKCSAAGRRVRLTAGLLSAQESASRRAATWRAGSAAPGEDHRAPAFTSLPRAPCHQRFLRVELQCTHRLPCAEAYAARARPGRDRCSSRRVDNYTHERTRSARGPRASVRRGLSVPVVLGEP